MQEDYEEETLEPDTEELDAGDLDSEALTDGSADLEPVEPENNQKDPQIEAQAREMGWVPEDQFRGPQDKWRPADEFVRRGEEILPIVQSQLRKTKAEHQQLAQAFEKKEIEFNQRLERMDNVYRKAAENQRMVSVQDIEAQKLQAVELGDTQLYKQLTDRENALFRDFSIDEESQAQPNEPQQGTPQVQQEVIDWGERNQWFLSDPYLNSIAQAEEQRIRQQFPGLSLAEQLDEVTRAVKERHPEKFNIAPRAQKQNFSTVEGTQRSTGSRKVGKGWNDIPAADRKTGSSLLEDGTFKSKDEYAKAYWSQ